MPHVTYVEPDGATHRVEIATGTNLMRVALDKAFPGITGDCGGVCACGTCHIVIAPEWASQTGARSEMEESMLELADDVQETSRLACQIEMTDSLDGLVVFLPDADGQ